MSGYVRLPTPEQYANMKREQREQAVKLWKQNKQIAVREARVNQMTLARLARAEKREMRLMAMEEQWEQDLLEVEAQMRRRLAASPSKVEGDALAAAERRRILDQEVAIFDRSRRNRSGDGGKAHS